jgi:hypothetical protein
MGDGLVKIVVPPGGLASGTRVYTADGSEVRGVTSIDVRLSANSLVTATIGLHLSTGAEIEAHPLLTEETLRRSAVALGYSLVKGDGIIRTHVQSDGNDSTLEHLQWSGIRS